MKRKWLYWLCGLSLVASGFCFSLFDRSNGTYRYHQHLEQPSEAELGPCQVCGGKSALCTHLPILRVDTGGQKIPGKAILDDNYVATGYETGVNGEEEILVSLDTVEEEGVWHHGEDPASQSAKALFRIRGNSSRAFSKSNYRIQLVEQDDPTQNRSLPLLGMASGNTWSLHGPFLDKTLIRNYMWMNLSAEVMGYAPNVRFCELILDGQYQGLYVLMETIEVAPGRVELTEYEDGDPVCSYLVHIEPHADPQKTIEDFSTYTLRIDEGRQMEIRYPSFSHQSQAVRDYITTDFSEIAYGLYSYSMSNGTLDYASLLDVDSFVNYYILQEFLAVNDAFSSSTYFYKDARGKLAIGPVWDYNNALDNFILPFPAEGFLLSQRGWFSRLMTDEAFVDQVVSRYRQLRRGLLSDENLQAYVDETVDWLGSAVQRNYDVWGYSFDAEQLSPAERRRPAPGSQQTVADVNASSYEEALEWMEDYMLTRGAWLDEHIKSLYQYCRKSKNAAQYLG